jgi:hypothetical protein
VPTDKKRPKKIEIPDIEFSPPAQAEGTKKLLKELEDRRKNRDTSVNKRGR